MFSYCTKIVGRRSWWMVGCTEHRILTPKVCVYINIFPFLTKSWSSDIWTSCRFISMCNFMLTFTEGLFQWNQPFWIWPLLDFNNENNSFNIKKHGNTCITKSCYQCLHYPCQIMLSLSFQIFNLFCLRNVNTVDIFDCPCSPVWLCWQPQPYVAVDSHLTGLSLSN